MPGEEGEGPGQDTEGGGGDQGVDQAELQSYRLLALVELSQLVFHFACFAFLCASNSLESSGFRKVFRILPKLRTREIGTINIIII